MFEEHRYTWKLRGIEMGCDYQIPWDMHFFWMAEARAAMIIKLERFVVVPEDDNGFIQE